MSGFQLSGLLALDELSAGSLTAQPGGRLNVDGYPAVPEQVAAAQNYTIEGYYVDRCSTGKDGELVVIPVSGLMTRDWSWNNAFSNTFIAAMLDKVKQDKDKVGAVLLMNTPGGTVDSLDELAAAVAAFRQEKPIVAMVHQCLSGGLWAASPCHEIIMADNTVSRIGSIGTIYLHTNLTKQYALQGVDPKIFRSTGSNDKARLNAIEPLTPELEAEIQRDIDASNKAFKATVRLGRGAKIQSDEIFTGRVYNAQDAVRLGLADRKGTLQTAYERVLSLSKSINK